MRPCADSLRSWVARSGRRCIHGRPVATSHRPAPNNAAKALMPDDYKNNAVIFPPADILAKCEYAKFNPDLQSKYEEAFTRVRAA